MNKLLNNNTDLMVLLFTIASIGLAYLKIMDVKDFGALALLVLGYKFAKGQSIQNDIPKLPQVEGGTNN